MTIPCRISLLTSDSVTDFDDDGFRLQSSSSFAAEHDEILARYHRLRKQFSHHKVRRVTALCRWKVGEKSRADSLHYTNIFVIKIAAIILHEVT